MAAVAKGPEVHPVTVPGYEVSDKGVLTEDVAAGDLLAYEGTMDAGQPKLRKAPAGALDAAGMAPRSGKAGRRGFSLLVQGEADGFTGLTPGTELFPSGAVAGGLDTTKPAGATARVRAVSTTRVRFNFV